MTKKKVIRNFFLKKSFGNLVREMCFPSPKTRCQVSTHAYRPKSPPMHIGLMMLHVEQSCRVTIITCGNIVFLQVAYTCGWPRLFCLLARYYGFRYTVCGCIWVDGRVGGLRVTRMNGCMDEWRYWMDGVDGLVERWVNGLVNAWMCG